MKKNGVRWTIAVLLALAVAPVHGAPQAEDAYVIDAMVMAIPAEGAEDVAVTGLAIRSSPAQDGKIPTMVSDVSEIRVGELSLTFNDARAPLWNGRPDPPADAGVEVLSSPRLLTTAGERAVVVAGSRLQYLERQGDGLFRLRVTDPESAPGVEFSCTVEPESGDRLVMDYELRLTVMEGREPIAGVNLEVGRPILRTRQVATRVRLALGQWTVLSGQLVEEAAGERGDMLLVLLRVQEAYID